MVTIPLKGRRRALGTLVMEEVRIDPAAQMELLERADEMGRQLAAAIENVLLLDAVLRSRRDLENTFNSLADLVAVCDQHGRLVYMNVAFLAASARRAKHADRSARSQRSSAPGDERPRVIARAIMDSASTSVSAEVEDPKAAWHVPDHADAARRRRTRADGVVLVARDVTPQAELEAERAELRNRLVQSEKLAALGQFVAGIAHELNNPLQGVLGHIELLRATGAFPKALRRDMQRIYREADRAAKIVRNLLVFAGSRRLVRRRTSINAALSRVLSLRAPAFRAANIEIVRRHSDALPRVKADPLLLHQALLNIVLNAEHAIGAVADASKPAHRCVAKAALRRSSCKFGTPVTGIPAAGDAASVRAVLHDKRSRQGNGPRAGDHLWHYSRARRTHRGVESSGGRRGVHGAASRRNRLVSKAWTRSGAGHRAPINGRDVSHDRRGARVPSGQLAHGLPAHQGRQDSRRAGRTPMALPQTRHRRLARQPAAPRRVARHAGDRHKPLRPLRARLPNARAFSSSTMSRASAICCPRRWRSPSTTSILRRTGDRRSSGCACIPYDLLIADLKMPGIDGLSVIREAKRLKTDLPVIIITGYSTETAAIEAVNLGVSGYLTKPFRVPQVLAAAAKAIGEPA